MKRSARRKSVRVDLPRRRWPLAAGTLLRVLDLPRRRCALAACTLSLLACGGRTGTIAVTLTTAPGSTVLDSVQTLRLTVSEPPSVETAERTGNGFDIALELEATGETTRLFVDGLDSAGTIVATGASPGFPVGAIDANIVIYMAPPNSVGAAPRALEPRSEMASGALVYGAIFAGGRDASGAATTSVAVYNAFDHSIISGLSLPAARAGMALGVGGEDGVYMFGGRDTANMPTATLWTFKTSVAPAGAYIDHGTKDGFARADEIMLPIGDERFLLSGAPPAELSGTDGSVIARETDPLPPAGATVVASDGIPTTIFAGPGGVTRFRTGTFNSLAIAEAARPDADVVAVAGGRVAVVCGTTDAVRIDAAAGTAEIIPGVPSMAKSGCASAATAQYLVIAGGTTASGVDGSVEVYDAATFALVGTLQLGVPRTNAVAVALPNDQLLIAGGVDAAGAPVGIIELYTPPAR